MEKRKCIFAFRSRSARDSWGGLGQESSLKGGVAEKVKPADTRSS